MFLELLKKGYLASIDIFLAKELAQEAGCVDESVIAFLCYLSLASRQGHLCVIPAEDALFPRIHELVVTKEHLEELDAFEKLARAGIEKLPLDVIKHQVCCEAGRYYFFRSWMLQELFLKHFQRLKNCLPELSLDLSWIAKRVDELTEKRGVAATASENNFNGLCKCSYNDLWRPWNRKNLYRCPPNPHFLARTVSRTSKTCADHFSCSHRKSCKPSRS